MRDLLVVGGGPAGASTAAWAARAGLDVLLVDRATFPRAKPCAEYLSPEATRDLDALGVLEEVEASGAARLTGMRIVAGSAGRRRAARTGPMGSRCPARASTRSCSRPRRAPAPSCARA
jgi:2-polyprenyl-6-methoxyphenol hydroxylase-like FAD-dependent oxidoreductase